MRILWLLLLLLFPLHVHALTGDWQTTERVKARLISGVTATGDLAEVPLGLEVELAPTWHSYWRSPGEAGLPPQLDWQASQNVKTIAIDYPWPERKIILGIENFLYEHAVIYPLRLAVQQPGQPVSLKVNLSLLTCADICVPNDLTLTLELPAGPATASDQEPRLAAYRATVPQRVPDASTAIIQDVAISEQPPGLRFKANSQAITDNMMVIAEAPVSLRFEPVRILERTDSGASLLLPLASAEDIATLKTVKELTLNINTDSTNPAAAQRFEQAITLTTVAAAPTSLAPASQPVPPAFIVILLFAFLGGLILNIMPCVLPVLSLKILSVIKHSEYGPERIRQSFLYSAAGIVFSFLVLAALLIGLRAAGATVGWGVQFQQPIFIGVLAVIVALFALNLLGLFEIQLGSKAQTALASASNRKGHIGDFLQGAFATLLATPCTAPFLGTAAGFAVIAPAPQILLIFLMMGLGLALPYLVLAAYPSLARHMPKPGRWMQQVRVALGIALLATVAWLLFVLMGQIDPRPMTDPAELSQEKVSWQKFDDEQIPALVQNGKIVFVDVTARWCLTCLYNKRTVTDTDDIAAELNKPDHVAMLADWTNPDPKITAYLVSFQRSGIPFNVVYGPGAPQGIVLPELLTKGAVINALQQARKAP
jgi:suppressor for copper-sensitivity B